jgi:hypothetical protein
LIWLGGGFLVLKFGSKLSGVTLFFNSTGTVIIFHFFQVFGACQKRALSKGIYANEKPIFTHYLDQVGKRIHAYSPAKDISVYMYDLSVQKAAKP